MTVLLFPGLGGSPRGHWQHHWMSDLADAQIVRQDDFRRPDLDSWLATAKCAILAHPGAILVGHSLGAILIAQLAARLPSLPISGALLVAPADVDDASVALPEVTGFGPMPTVAFPFPAIVVASRTDPFMRYERARLLASMWEAGLVDLGDAGHINIASGHGPWREGRMLVEQIAGRGSRAVLRHSDTSVARRQRRTARSMVIVS